MNEKVIVIVPAFNEAEKIGETIRALVDFKSLSTNFELQIYVIDDGSVDGTNSISVKSGADKVIRHKVNQGLGAAVRTGLMIARRDNADIVVKFDADLQHDPNDIKGIVNIILNDEADVVYGNRFEKISYKMPFIRRIGNLTFTFFMRWLTKWPLHDSQPGIFATNKYYLEKFKLPGDYNYTQQIILDAYHKGMRFAHYPVSFRKRTTGKSFVSLKYPLKVIPQILMVIVGIKPMKIFAPIGFISFSIGMLLLSFEMASWVFGMAPKPVMHVNAVLGSMIFGLQTFFFGIIAQLIINTKKEC